MKPAEARITRSSRPAGLHRITRQKWPRLCAVVIALLPVPALAQPHPNRIDTPLTPIAGDPDAGRRIIEDRALSACLLCHAGPFPARHLQGNIGPDLTGVGARLDSAQLRLRLVDSMRINPETVMPPYFVTGGLNRVGRQWHGRTILSAQQIEDVVACLATLTTP